MNKKDDIRTFVVIIIVCIICVIIGLIFSFKPNSNKLISVNDYNQFFSNVKCVNNYINYIVSGDSTAVYSLLHKNYIKDNDITINNVLNYVEDYEFGTSFNATSIDYVKINDDFIYYIKGNIYLATYEDTELLNDNFSIILVNDTDKMSYSLYPVNDNNYEEIINSIWKVNVKSNSYNAIDEGSSISKEQICVMYLSDFVSNIFNDINDSYMILSDDMKKKYTKESYNRYINNNINKISTVADKCKLDEYEDKRVYTVIDSKENTYIFTEESIMNYKVDFYLKENF